MISVNDLAEKLNIPQNTLSAHLKILYDGSYIDKKQQWRSVNYFLKEDKIRLIFELGCEVLHEKWQGNWEKIDDAKNRLAKLTKTNLLSKPKENLNE